MLKMQYFCTWGGSPPSHLSSIDLGQTLVTQQSILATRGGTTSSPKGKPDTSRLRQFKGALRSSTAVSNSAQKSLTLITILSCLCTSITSTGLLSPTASGTSRIWKSLSGTVKSRPSTSGIKMGRENPLELRNGRVNSLPLWTTYVGQNWLLLKVFKNRFLKHQGTSATPPGSVASKNRRSSNFSTKTFVPIWGGFNVASSSEGLCRWKLVLGFITDGPQSDWHLGQWYLSTLCTPTRPRICRYKKRKMSKINVNKLIFCCWLHIELLDSTEHS